MQQLSVLTSPLRTRLLSGGAWAFAGKVASAVTSLLISAALTRLVSPGEVGTYFLIFSLVMVAATAAQFGLNQAAVRLIAEAMARTNTGAVRSIARRIFGIAAGSTAFLALLLYWGGGAWLAEKIFHSDDMSRAMGLTVLWVIAFSFQSLLAECFRGLYDIKLATLFQGLSANLLLLALLASTWLVYRQASLKLILVYMVITVAASALVAAILFYMRIRNFPRRPASGYGVREILRVTWPLLITNLTILALSQTSIWILGMYSTDEDIALYGAAIRLITLVAMPLMIANAVLPPVITELFTLGDYRKLERVLRTSAFITGLPALAVVAGFILFSEFILARIFGEFYVQASSILFILSIGQIVNIWAGSSGLTLMMTGNQTTMMAVTAASGVATVALSLAIVDDWGAPGVAVATATGLVLQNVLMLAYARKRLGIWTHAKITWVPIREVLKR